MVHRLSHFRRPARLGIRMLLAATAAGWLLAATASPPPRDAADDTQFAAWVRNMRHERLGPFVGVRWFCSDGQILPPREYACVDHGGGRQSGLRDPRAEAIRAAGIPIANVLSELTPDAALADDARLLKAVIVERYLVATNDGWILHYARDVRGMFQAEDEAAAAQQILLQLAQDTRVPETRFLLLREAVRQLPRPLSATGYEQARALADEVVEIDPDFAALRNRIHSRPDAELATLVRAHIPMHEDDPELDAALETLATAIDDAFATPNQARRIEQAAAGLDDADLTAMAGLYRSRVDPGERLGLLSSILARVRDAMPRYSSAHRLQAMRLSLAVEDVAFAVSAAMPAPTLSRRAQLRGFLPLVDALYGSGLLSGRERQTLRQTLDGLIAAHGITVGDYRHALAVLARAPGWAARRLAFHLGPMITTFERVEPRAGELIPDRLHESLMLAWSARLERLMADSDRLAGVRQDLFGHAVPGGLRALNPGLARGMLVGLDAARDAHQGPIIVLAPETTAALPAVAGIITESAGNALSHVQLLARNLGLPNVVVGSAQLPALRAHVGSRIVLAASPGGVVRIEADSPSWDDWFPKAATRPVHLVVDTDRLDLSRRAPIPLSELRAADAGHIVGPKAANLGELAQHFPGMVSPALAIPFGAYRQVLDATGPDGSRPMLEWLQTQYRLLDRIEDPVEQQQALKRFLQTTRAWFAAVPFPPGFVDALRSAAETTFGADGQYGVYVRSDTNLEDLPGFTGAGLNRTVPNVVGFDAVLDAIRTVWASPFTERAYGWRQLAMDRPEQIYVSVLLHKTVASDISGVMVTADPASGDTGTIYVTANEGAGGSVDGQSAESLRVRLSDGQVDLVSSATEPTRRETLAAGGLRAVPASGADHLVSDAQIRQLTELAREIPQRYPQLHDDRGNVAPADVEFAFAGGRLYLLQIRPFLQSARARHDAFLTTLDRGIDAGLDTEVAMDAPP